MKNFLIPLVLVLILSFARADSGGPYEFVPDLAADEKPPLCAIPSATHPLDFYLKNIPELQWDRDRKVNEPVTFTWTPVVNYHAAPSDPGPLPYAKVVVIRYISHARLKQGSLQAEAVLILASRNSGRDYTPVFFTTGGASVENHRVTLTEGTEDSLSIFRDLSGTGGFVEEVRLRVTESGFVRTRK